MKQEEIVNITLSGKVAMITGASSGMGLEMIPVFFEAGARGVVGVFLHSDLPPALECHKTQ
jgi:NAD(P)-dependent dehydrogenase (short-subunit alcohol dehydrogenase family)